MIPNQTPAVNPKKRAPTTIEEEVKDLNPEKQKMLLPPDIETQKDQIISYFYQSVLPILGKDNQKKYRELIDNLKMVLNSQLKRCCDRLSYELAKEPIINDTIVIIFKLTNKLIVLAQDLADLPKNNMENKAREFFMKIYPDFLINFTEKQGGSQLGFKVTLQNNDAQNSIIYHCKTHTYGRLSSKNSSEASTVDLKEMIVYRVLEKCDLGNKTLFFFDDIRNFYIATLDSGSNFKNYDKLNNDLLETDVFAAGCIAADIILRIFHLWDILNNSGNFGMGQVNDKFFFKILDFRIPEPMGSYENQQIFEEWRKSNTRLNYVDPDILKILKIKEEEKIKKTFLVIQSLQNFEKYLDDSLKEIQNEVIQQLDFEEKLKKDLERYCEDSKKNFWKLNNEIKTKSNKDGRDSQGEEGNKSNTKEEEIKTNKQGDEEEKINYGNDKNSKI